MLVFCSKANKDLFWHRGPKLAGITKNKTYIVVKWWKQDLLILVSRYKYAGHRICIMMLLCSITPSPLCPRGTYTLWYFIDKPVAYCLLCFSEMHSISSVAQNSGPKNCICTKKEKGKVLKNRTVKIFRLENQFKSFKLTQPVSFPDRIRKLIWITVLNGMFLN